MKTPEAKITPLDLILGVMVFAGGLYLAYRIGSDLHYRWNWGAIPQYLFRFDEASGRWVPNLLIQGLAATIRLSFWGTLLACLIGTLMGFFRISHTLFNRLLGQAYVEICRNLPPLVIIFIFYYFISDQIMPILGVDSFIRSCDPGTRHLLSMLFAPPEYFSVFISAVLTLAIFEGAYITEIVRAGIQSIEKEQWEASKALGMGRGQMMRHVILPQAVQRILPPLAGQFISTIKDSAIVSVISIQELTFQGMEIMAATHLTFEVWITISVLYLFLTLSCSLFVARLETRMNRHRR